MKAETRSDGFRRAVKRNYYKYQSIIHIKGNNTSTVVLYLFRGISFIFSFLERNQERKTQSHNSRLLLVVNLWICQWKHSVWKNTGRCLEINSHHNQGTSHISWRDENSTGSWDVLNIWRIQNICSGVLPICRIIYWAINTVRMCVLMYVSQQETLGDLWLLIGSK